MTCVPPSVHVLPTPSRQQTAPPGLRSGLQSGVPRVMQPLPPKTHFPPMAAHAAGPESPASSGASPTVLLTGVTSLEPASPAAVSRTPASLGDPVLLLAHAAPTANSKVKGRARTTSAPVASPVPAALGLALRLTPDRGVCQIVPHPDRDDVEAAYPCEGETCRATALASCSTTSAWPVRSSAEDPAHNFESDADRPIVAPGSLSGRPTHAPDHAGLGERHPH